MNPSTSLRCTMPSAADVVRIITSLNQGQGAEGAGAAVKVVADERTNSILLTGEKSQRLRLKALIVNMDTPLSTGGDTQVGTCAMPTPKRSPTSSRARPPPPPRRRAARPPGPRRAAAARPNVDASVTIWADVATNALIITAPPKIMKSLMAVIDKLDIRRAQVQVEALIVEVDVNKSSNLGVQWLLFGQGNSTVPAGVINLPGAGTSIVDLAAAALSGGTRARPSTTVPGSTGNAHHQQLDRRDRRHASPSAAWSTTASSFAALVQALRSDGSSNIISTPSLITMNNEEAEVKVTQEIPLITGSYTNYDRERGGHHQPLRDHSARGSGHDPQGHPAHQRRQFGAAEDRAGRLLAGSEADRFGRYFHQQALHQDHGADRGRRHHRARRPDVGYRDARARIAFRGSAPFPCSAICSSRAAARARRRTCWCSFARNMRDAEATESTSEDEIQLDCGRSSKPQQRAYHAVAGPEAARRAGDAAGHRACRAPPPSGANAQGATPNPPRHATAHRSRASRSAPPHRTPPPATHAAAMSAELKEPGEQRKLSFPFAKRHGVLVRGIADGVADTVCRPGVTPQSLAEVRRFVGVPLKLERVSVESFDSMLRIAYEAGSGAAMQMLEGLDDNTDLAHLAEDIPESSDLLESDDEAPIIRLINALLTQAVKENASDIHIEPYENRLVIRFRVDGVLREVLQTKRAVAPLVVSRIKVMSKLDIAERRLPQDGRISLRIAGRAVDVRVSTLPSGHGERVVLRLLDKQAGRIELTSLGDGPAHPGDDG